MSFDSQAPPLQMQLVLARCKQQYWLRGISSAADTNQLFVGAALWVCTVGLFCGGSTSEWHESTPW